MRLSRICVWACPAKFLAKILIRPVFGSVRFRVFVRRRGRRVPGRGATSAARQDKKIAGPGGSEGPRIPPQRSLSLWAISQTPGHERMRTHAGGPGPRRGRFWAFHGEEINASCLRCPCARGKLPNPTSRVGQQAGRTPLSRPPTLGTAAAGPVTPAGRVWGARRTPRDFFPGEKRWSVDAVAVSDKSGKHPAV
jgi:hypothetical protein